VNGDCLQSVTALNDACLGCLGDQDTGYILWASNGQFTATRFTENPGVDYPRDLVRIKAACAEEVAAAWPRIKQPLAQAVTAS